MVREHDTTALRAFHGGAAKIRRSFQSDAEARAVFAQILQAAGLAGMQDRIIVRASAETDAAEATIEKDERLIFYNAVFMQKLRADAKDYWPTVAVLAHELGHHVRLHTVLPGREHEFELEADYQAGYIMRRMGATIDQAQQLFRTIGTEAATPSHPGRAQRLQAVTLGWTDGGGEVGLGPVATPVAAPPIRPQLPTLTQSASTDQKQAAAAKGPAEQPAPKPAPADPPSQCDGGVMATVANERRCLKPKDTFKD